MGQINEFNSIDLSASPMSKANSYLSSNPNVPFQA